MSTSFKTLGYKSLRDRLYVLFLGVVFLLVMNRQIYGGIDSYMMIILVISGALLYFKIKLYVYTMYEFTPQTLIIKTSKKQSYKLPLKDIEKIISIKNGFVISKLLSTYKNGSRIVDYSTSIKHQRAIHMKDGITVIISPRKLSKPIKKLYPFK